MIIIGTVKSWNKDTNKDCFGYGNPSNIDHTWPTSKDGNNINENRQRLSIVSNESKGDKVSGNVNSTWKFCVVKNKNKNQKIYGVMYIRNINWDEDNWKRVEPVK